MLIVRMTMLVEDRNFLQLFSSKFRFREEIEYFYLRIIENVKTMQNMKKTNFEKNGDRIFFRVTADLL